MIVWRIVMRGVYNGDNAGSCSEHLITVKSDICCVVYYLNQNHILSRHQLEPRKCDLNSEVIVKGRGPYREVPLMQKGKICCVGHVTL